MIFVVTKCCKIFFIALCFGFMSSLLCRGDLLYALALCLGFVLTSYVEIVSFVESLVERVEILLSEGGDVSLVLEP